MNSNDFGNAVRGRKLPNGSKFVVTLGKTKIGTVGVIDTTVVYLDMPKGVPMDLYTNNNYIFTPVKEA